MKNINKLEEESLTLEIDHIIDSGVNHIRILRLIDNFLERKKTKEKFECPNCKSKNYDQISKSLDKCRDCGHTWDVNL
jgi:transposase-like protein